MRTKVTFTYPVPPQSPEPEFTDVLPVEQAGWFTDLLARIERAEVDRELCQEDWGVVAFVKRDECEFWIGLSWEGDETEFLSHIHHGSFAFLQWFSRKGRTAREALVRDFEKALLASGATKLKWFEEKDREYRNPSDAP